MNNKRIYLPNKKKSGSVIVEALLIGAIIIVAAIYMTTSSVSFLKKNTVTGMDFLRNSYVPEVAL